MKNTATSTLQRFTIFKNTLVAPVAVAVSFMAAGCLPSSEFNPAKAVFGSDGIFSKVAHTVSSVIKSNPLGRPSEVNVVATASTVAKPKTAVFSGPTTVVAGLCSSAFTYTTTTAGLTPANVTASTTVLLSHNGVGTFYTDSSCLTSTVAVTIAAGENTKSFYFKSATGGQALTVTADATIEGAALTVSGSLAVSAAVPYSIELTQSPSSSATISTALTTKPVITLKDSTGATYSTTNNATVAAYTNAACTAAAPGTLGQTTLAAVGGVVTYTNALVYDQAATIYLKFTLEGISSSCVGPIAITAAPASATVASGNSQSGAVGTQLALPLIVTINDSLSAPIEGVSVTWAVTAGGGTLSAATSSTNASGQAQITYTLGSSSGVNTITATAGGFTATFTVSATVCVGAALTNTVSFASGDGSSGTPYVICNKEQWNLIGANAGYMSKYFQLGIDVDFLSSAANFTPIGNSTTAFTGQFDGLSFTISNVVINGTNGGNESKSGMFRNLGAGAYVHDFTVNNVSYTQTVAGNSYMGAVIGWAQGSSWPANGGNTNVVRLSNITVSGTINVTNGTGSMGDGGLGGFAGVIIDSVVSGITVNATSGSISAAGCTRVGGLVGYAYDPSSIASSSSNLEIASAASSAGGLVGYHHNCGLTVTTSKATGNVTGSGGQLGGFFGNSNCPFTITKSVATGTVTSSSAGAHFAIGGFCGSYCNATDSYATGNVRAADTTSSRKGGFCGYTCTISNSYSTGNILYNSGGGVYVQDNTSTDTGGLCGQSASCTVSNSFWSTDTSLATSPGGGTGVSTAKLQDRSFLVSNGWDFASTWRTPPALPSTYNNNDFPIQQWQTTGYTNPTVASILTSGTGTSGDPYLISSAADLRNISYAIQLDSNVALAYFKIPNATTIDLTGLAAPAIGSSTTPFRGHFDGNGQTISNLSATSTHSYSGALFNYLGAGAYIHDLTVSGASMTLSGTTYMYTGAVVGYAAGSAWDAATICDGSTLASATTVSSTKVRLCNITVGGAISVSVPDNSGNAGYPGVGGFIGAMTNTAISNVSVAASSGTINAAGNQYVGGFLGYAISRNSISGSSSNVDVASAYSNAGGFIGYQYDGVCTQTTVTNSKASGNITGSYSSLGGFLGGSNCWAGNPITNSVATGTVTRTVAGTWSNIYLGGFCGTGCDATNSYATGDVRTQDTLTQRKGGFCGGGCHITNSYSIGNITYNSGGGVYVQDNTSTDTGGLCGQSGSCTVSNSFWSTDTSLATSPGGGTGVSTAKLQDKTFLISNGWSFSSTWRTPPALPSVYNNNDFPIQQWQTTGYTTPTVASLLASGTGTSGDPYLISTAADLRNISYAIQLDSNVALAYFKIPNATTIDLTGLAAPAIGSSTTPFRGHFDGNGQTISNLSATSTHSYAGALFNYLGAGAYVHDLTVSGASMTVSGTTFNYTGAVIGYAAGSAWDAATICDGSTLASATTASSTKARLCNITVGGTIAVSVPDNSANYGSVGGFIGGMTNTAISNVSVAASSGTINAAGNVYVGGFLGYAISRNSISGSSSNVDVASAYSNAGGFIGYQYDGACTQTTVTNSKASGNVTGSYGSLGGFLGGSNCWAGNPITNSVATGTVTSTVASGLFYLGGFCGTGCDATNSYSTGNVRAATTTSTRKGGFCGGGCHITNSYSIGDVKYNSGGGVYVQDNTSTDTGGLCGQSASCTVSNSFWSTDTSLATSPGGGTAKTTAELQTAATLNASGANWSTATWTLSDGSYPKLSWEP